MTPMHITLEPANQPDVIALINALDAFQKPLYPAECHYGIDIDALSQPNVLFAVARLPGSRAAVGCGALVLNEDYAELKRMFTDPVHRGRGIASSLLGLLESEARARGWTRFALETGTLQPEAHALYERHGYQRCGPFGDYPDDPHSVFMCKTT